MTCASRKQARDPRSAFNVGNKSRRDDVKHRRALTAAGGGQTGPRCQLLAVQSGDACLIEKEKA